MRRLALFCLLLFARTVSGAAAPAQELVLRYDTPAARWVEALPLGNGRLGAMVYGDPAHEEFQLNEETVWGGSPHNNTNPAAREALPRIRQLIFEGRNAEAQALCGEAICSTGPNGMPYQTVGSLHLDFELPGAVTDYARELDLRQAVATTRFTAGGVDYTREAFTSFEDQLLIVRLTASRPGALSFTARYTTPYPDGIRRTTPSAALLRLDGKALDHEGIAGKVRFTALTRIEAEGGHVQARADTLLRVTGADRVTLYVSIGTNFIDYKDVSGDAAATAAKYLARAPHDYARAKAAHTARYAAQFSRTELDLGRTAQAAKPTDRRIREFAATYDPQLVALYFQFGRYLLICSSQPGGQAANLQGIWNDRLRAPWDGKYTTDINVEMNYWPAEVTSLSETHEPFLRLVRECAAQGRASAAMYGCRGWTLHHNTDIWRTTGAVDGPAYGIWPTCNAWFAQHLWDRYLFSGDTHYLREVYPLLRGAAEFYLDFLVRDPRNGYLVAAPSYSPENKPRVNGKRSFVVVAGTTMDNQMIGDLMRNTIEAGAVVGEDKAFTDSLRHAVALLQPMQVGRWGQLQEWMEDWDDPKDRHRHTSHLWGLYPGRQITLQTPELMAAARRTLAARGDHSTGWSMGWKVCFWARLLDGDHALKLITEQLTPTVDERGQNGGTYPNLFDAHPPFQIDGNFGCTAGIAEMLVQSHAGAVHLLPALPAAWSEGSLRGIRCRGGFVIDRMTWHAGRLAEVRIRSTRGGMLRLRTTAPLTFRGKSLPAATTAACSNPLLAPQSILPPRIDPAALRDTLRLPAYYEYDLPTRADKTYVLRAQ